MGTCYMEEPTQGSLVPDRGRRNGTGCQDAWDTRLATLYHAMIYYAVSCYALSDPPDVYAARYRYTIARNIENN
jgi:hypothetical protein